jgi:CRISPR/Cas system-associated endoribonuclease Cas2
MEVFEFTRLGVSYKQVWFNTENSLSQDIFSKADIIEFKESYKELQGLYQFQNGVINLDKGLEQVHEKFEKGFKYEIRRAEKEQFSCFEAELTEETFQSVYQEYKAFSEKKGLPLIGSNFLKLYMSRQALRVTGVRLAETIFQYHVYYESSRELILLASFPVFNQANSIKKSALGFANRYLHWFDIQLAARLGKQKYNLGGIGNSNDPAILTIANFKKEMSPDSVGYFQGVIPVSRKGRFFLSLKRSIRRYVKYT